MRRAAKTDANQAAIVAELRKRGASVQPLHVIGSGCPDLLIGIAGKNLLLEVKDGSKIPSKQQLTQDEQQWHSSWKGQVCVVSSIEQAIELLAKVGSTVELKGG